MRGVRWYLVGSVLLVVLAGCGKSYFAQREAWRHEAEVQCLKSGAVKEGAGVVRVKQIDGPGICGADFPLKVAALGTGGSVRSQHPLTAHFGLGEVDRVEAVEIRWPGGAVTRLAGPEIELNRAHWINAPER